MSFELTPLPYDYDALAPYISRETLTFHHDKHHKTYVDKLNTLVEGTPLADASLETIIKTTDNAGIFNNAAQDWNHTFYWHCLSPNGGKSPTGQLLETITTHFESVENFKKLFTETAINTFGSGWAWLVKCNDGSVALKSTSNAGNPLTDGQQPLLVCDVWEHAYYIDYRNVRPAYLDAFWALVNWDFVAENLDS